MPVPVLTVAEMRAWEKVSWAAGVTEATVIHQVGGAIAKSISQITQSGDRVLILAGVGNNGADARAAGAQLSNRIVECLEIKAPSTALEPLAEALSRRPALVVDGLFGIGLNRALNRDWLAVAECINRAELPVLAVDLPSGLNADTGESWGAVIEATHTVTVGAPKVGLLAAAAVDSVGRLEVARHVGLIGDPPSSGSLLWSLPEDFSQRPVRRRPNVNKGNFGHVVILAGSVGYAGAAVLAARAASRARPGLVSVVTSPDAWQSVASQLVTAMVHPFTAQHAVLERGSAILVGPGLAASNLPTGIHSEVVRLWFEFPGVLVADASALDWLSAGVEPRGPRVITPHPGEAGRMLGISAAEVQEDRLAALRQLAELFHCLVVLKGHQTLIGSSMGPVYVNSVGNPGLAQGGTGDVLAGLLAGLLAQPSGRNDLQGATRRAVWQHGVAADSLEAASRNWTAEDLVREVSS